MDQKQIRVYAAKHNIKLNAVERHKLVYLPIPALPVTTQQKIYFPFDSELKNSVVTKIRCMNGGIGLPGEINNILINPPVVSGLNSFAIFVANFEGFDGKLVFENIPMFLFLQSAGINVNRGWHCFLRYIPERSYLTYFNVGAAVGGFTFVFDFTYHSLIHD